MGEVSWQRLIKLAFVLGAAMLLIAPAISRQPQDGAANRPATTPFAPAPEWRPTHATGEGRYVGNAACAQCHTQTATQPTTPMGRALESGAQCEVLRKHPQLTFKSGIYSYSIVRDGERSLYTVTDGNESFSTPILWAFGQGKAGQTYVFQRDGKYYESRVSYFQELDGLDYTLGSPRKPAASLAEAAGRAMDSLDARDCFSCHATAVSKRGDVQTAALTPGITCEGCHGAGERHVAAMKARDFKNKQILNPGHFDTNGQTEFCGSCHRTWSHVQMMRVQGVGNVRFQPYRLFGSKCYDLDDRRISCTACHNPHEELKRDAAFYDAKCAACHQPQAKAAKITHVCPVGKQNCASCHMPKYELPGSHFKFTDHQIRVVRPNEAYPN